MSSISTNNDQILNNVYIKKHHAKLQKRLQHGAYSEFSVRCFCFLGVR